MSTTLKVGVELNLSGEGVRPQRFFLRIGEQFVVGRGAVDIVIDDGWVSREHLLIELRVDGLFLTDLGSTNGTQLNSSQLPPKHPVRVSSDGLVVLGSYQIHIRIASSDDERLTARGLDFLPKAEFEVLGRIGHGAVSTVWAARQPHLDRRVALKVLDPALIEPDRVEYKRFHREAKLYTSVDSPYLVHIYALRVERGQPFMVMELVQGPTARERLSQGPLEIPEAMRIAEDVASGLAALAEVDIVHRDVKPGNILLTPRGLAKLGDFGLAKSMGDDAGTLTDHGEGLGSVPYVSPEQAYSALEADHRSDMYSLGATLYHLVAWAPPFQFEPEQNLIEKLRVIEGQVPEPLAERMPECPRELSELVARMLSKEPAERPTSAAEVAKTLQTLRRTYFPDWLPSAAEDRDTSNVAKLPADYDVPRD